MQPLMYGAPFYGGIVPYTYPAPAAPGVQGSESSAKIEKAVSSQPMAIANGSTGATLASLPPRVSYLLISAVVLVTCWRGI